MRKLGVKILLCMLVSLSLIGTSSDTAWASDSFPPEVMYEPYVSYNEETGYYIRLDDRAELLTSTEEQEVMQAMEPISAYGNVAFVSISDNPEYSTERYAENYYQEQFGYSSGILFLIDMEKRYIWIHCNGEILQTITTSYANTITDNVYSYASDGNYLLCTSKAFEQVNTLLEGRHIAQPMKYISNALLSVVIALLINYFLAMTLSRSRKATNSQLLNGIFSKTEIKNPQSQFVKQTKHYSPQSHSSSGVSGGSIGRSGGGFSGGSRGGGGGHRF